MVPLTRHWIVSKAGCPNMCMNPSVWFGHPSALAFSGSTPAEQQDCVTPTPQAQGIWRSLRHLDSGDERCATGYDYSHLHRK